MQRWSAAAYLVLALLAWDAEGQRRRAVSVQADAEVYALPTPYVTKILATDDGSIWWQGTVLGVLTPQREVVVVDRTSGYSSGFAIAPDGQLFISAHGEQRWSVIRRTRGGRTSEIRIRPDAGISNLAVRGDGTLWFTESEKDRLGSIDLQDTVTEIALPPTLDSPAGLAVDSQTGSLWVGAARAVAELRADGSIVEYSAESLLEGRVGDVRLNDIALSPDGSLWLRVTSESYFYMPRRGGEIVRMTPDGAFERVVSLPLKHDALHLTSGADGSVWFINHDSRYLSEVLARAWKDGTVAEYMVTNPATSKPYVIAEFEDITRDRDGNIWIAFIAFGGGSYLMKLGG